MSDKISPEEAPPSGWLRKTLVLLQLGIIIFLVFVALMGTGFLDGRSFFSQLVLFFLRIAGIEPPAAA